MSPGAWRATSDRSVVVLTNVMELQGNPYLRLWHEAVRRTGARVAPLTKDNLRAAGARRDALWIHLQWPERVLSDPNERVALRNLLRLLRLVATARVRGARVLVTAHNVWSHDRRHRVLESILWSALGLLATDLHLMSAADAPQFVASHPTFRWTRRHVIPHGNYDPVAAGAPSRSQSRDRLGIPAEARVFLTFGFLKSYKGADDLLDAFLSLEDPSSRLVIAGRLADERLARRLDTARATDPRVIVVPRFLSDDELSDWISAADCVVLPYRRILTSGSALLALTLGRPVVLPRTPSFVELHATVGADWVTLFDGPLTQDVLAAAPRHRGDGRPDLSWCDWDRIEGDLATLWQRRPGAEGGC